MKTLQNSAPVNWDEIYQLEPAERLQYINDQHRYPILFQEVSNYIYSKVKQLKGK